LCFWYCCTWFYLLINVLVTSPQQVAEDEWFPVQHCHIQRVNLDIILMTMTSVAVFLHCLHSNSSIKVGTDTIIVGLVLPLLAPLIHDKFVGVYEQRFITTKSLHNLGNETFYITTASVFCETHITAQWLWISCLEWLLTCAITCFFAYVSVTTTSNVCFASASKASSCFATSTHISISADFPLSKNTHMQ
ncbi:unnamed protein product, partial [Meganyctiphanes norvegica]